MADSPALHLHNSLRQAKDGSVVSAKTTFEPCKLMERVVEAVRQSVPERRADGKTCRPIATFAHGLVQKLLKPDNGARRKGMP